MYDSFYISTKTGQLNLHLIEMKKRQTLEKEMTHRRKFLGDRNALFPVLFGIILVQSKHSVGSELYM
jgi:hypothetical protein